MSLKRLAAVLAALFVMASSATAYAFEIQADRIHSDDGQIFEYRDNVEMRFAADETFEISAAAIEELDGAARYSGNVQIAFKSLRLVTDNALVTRQSDGGFVITLQSADMTVGKT